jgi:hypothetical protein
MYWGGNLVQKIALEAKADHTLAVTELQKPESHAYASAFDVEITVWPAVCPSP